MHHCEDATAAMVQKIGTPYPPLDPVIARLDRIIDLLEELVLNPRVQT